MLKRFWSSNSSEIFKIFKLTNSDPKISTKMMKHDDSLWILVTLMTGYIVPMLHPLPGLCPTVTRQDTGELTDPPA